MSIRTFLMTGSIIVLSACASTPEPAPIVETPVAEAPAPVFTQPAPVETVTQAPIAAPEVNLPTAGSVEDFIYQSGEDRIYFGYNRFDLSPDAREVLRRQAEWLKTYDRVTAVVAGNADERGTREYNLALGERRASTVKDYLVSLGVQPGRLTTVSYGKERPIDGRSNDEGWARNRNGHTNIVSGAVG